MATQKKKNNKQKEDEKQIEKDIEQIEKANKLIEEQIILNNMINDKTSSIREDLKNQLISQGKFGKQFDDMVEDYLYFVDLKERLKHDIDENGIRYENRGGNGFTTFKPNESCERLLKTNAQMLKILQDLELKAPDEGGGDEGDDLL